MGKCGVSFSGRSICERACRFCNAKFSACVPPAAANDGVFPTTSRNISSVEAMIPSRGTSKCLDPISLAIFSARNLVSSLLFLVLRYNVVKIAPARTRMLSENSATWRSGC